jgi:hypothetical protein
MICIHCSRRPVLPNGTTCGDSHCQEAAYWASVARNVKGKNLRQCRIRNNYQRKQRVCEELAGRTEELAGEIG